MAPLIYVKGPYTDKNHEQLTKAGCNSESLVEEVTKRVSSHGTVAYNLHDHTY